MASGVGQCVRSVSAEPCLSEFAGETLLSAGWAVTGGRGFLPANGGVMQPDEVV